MSKSRLLWLAGLVVIVQGSAPSGSARAADVRYLPEETDLVVSVHLEQICAASLVLAEPGTLDQFRILLNQLANDLPAWSFLRDVGFDAFRDFKRIRFACTRGQVLNASLVIIEGDFGALKLSARLTDIAKSSPGKLKVSAAAGVTIYEIADRRHYVALVNDTTLLATANREALTDALAHAGGSKKSGLPKPLATLLETVGDAPSISAVATGSALSGLLAGVAVPNIETAAAALKTLDAMSAAVTIEKDFQFQVGVFARDSAAARQLTNAADSALSLLRGLAQQKAAEDKDLLPVADVVKTLGVRSQGPVILVGGRASLDAIERLMKIRPPTGNAPGTR